eukprot:4186972-Prymnesium_polylepis.1
MAVVGSSRASHVWACARPPLQRGLPAHTHAHAHAPERGRGGGRGALRHREGPRWPMGKLR